MPARDLPTEDDSGRDERALPLLRTGSLIGRYVVLESLGAGGMGVVYAAFDPDLDRKVALKLLPARQRDGDRVRREERLIREAKAIAKLSHPNIVAIFDVGVHEDQVFLAMECLAGGTLKRWLGGDKRPWRDVVRVFLEAGRGLAAAHAEGLVHRDFKPENVLLDKNGVPKVVDFGLVRLEEAGAPETEKSLDGGDGAGSVSAADLALDLTPPQLTRTGALVGTPAYMAPEQFLGQRTDARSDQFAFSAALYEALYGERPFAGETVAELAKSVTVGELRAPSPGAAVPGWIRKLLARGLSRRPAERFPRLAELLQALSLDPVARRRRRAGVIAALLVVAASLGGLQRHFARKGLEFERQVASLLAEADRASRGAETDQKRLDALRREAFRSFDAGDHERGEQTWSEARAVSTSLDAGLERAEQSLQAALTLDEGRALTRRRLAETSFARAALAEQEVRREDLARHLAALAAVDAGGEQRRRWSQPGALSVRTAPPDARVAIDRLEAGGGARTTLTPVTPFGAPPPPELAPGSYRLRAAREGYADTLYPFVVGRGEPVSIALALPPAADVPRDYRYLPPGRFFYGDYDEDLRLAFLNAVPLHQREGRGVLISVRETTFSDWIGFLASLPPAEREARRPQSNAVQGAVALTQEHGGPWALRLTIAGRTVAARAGEPLVYPGRPKTAPAQDWLKMPVVGVSARDIRAYLAWLGTTGKVPGARFCTDVEWERAARGADERVFPSGLTRLAVADTNVDATYGRVPGAYGPDEVGRHPQGRSPFDLDDMAGNAWEIVTKEGAPDAFIATGGGYYHDVKSARSTNKEALEPELRSHLIGFRVCADLHLDPPSGRTSP